MVIGEKEKPTEPPRPAMAKIKRRLWNQMGKSAPFLSKYGISQKESKKRVMIKEIRSGSQVSKNISTPKKIIKTKITQEKIFFTFLNLKINKNKKTKIEKLRKKFK